MSMKDKTNIILALCDQMLGSALGCLGKEHVKTPDLDAFAHNGALFTNAVSNTPACTPARASLLAGILSVTLLACVNISAQEFEIKDEDPGTDPSTASAAFTPKTLAPFLWLDASDASTVKYGDSGHVHRWDDKSGHSHHATQGDPAKQPAYVKGAQNGKNVIRFSAGSKTGLATPGIPLETPDEFTLFAVFKGTKASETYSGPIFSPMSFHSWGIPARRISVKGHTSPKGRAGLHTFDPMIWSGILANGVNLDLWENGANVYSHKNGSPMPHDASTAYQIGQSGKDSYCFDGDICEVIGFDRALTAAEREKIEGYLAAKWGITGYEDPMMPEIFPAPAKMVRKDGSFVITPETVIVADAPSTATARQLADYLKPAMGFELKIVTEKPGAGASSITLAQDAALTSLGKEGYLLDVTPAGIRLSAPQQAGLFYGVQTLRQLLPVEVFSPAPVKGVAWSATGVSIEDQPLYGWRGLMLDSGHDFQRKEFVLKFIDLMALHKLNVFHWHLTDVGSWSLEIKGYPKLNDPITLGTGVKPGHYTHEDVREVVRYAAERHITVLPEIEMPGHASAALRAYPELDCPVPANVPGKAYTFCLGNEKTYQFLEEVLSQVVELFPGEYIHIAGDEAPPGRWEACPVCQRKMKAEKLDSGKALQHYQTLRMANFLKSKGRRAMGWDEIAEAGGLPPDVGVMAWRGQKFTIESLKAGHPTVAADAYRVYFDYRNRTIDTAYTFDPASHPSLSDADRKNLLGIQGQMWTNHLESEEQIQINVFPNSAALAEITWTPPALRDLGGFMKRLPTYLKRLDVMGIPHDDPFRPVIGRWAIKQDEKPTTLEWPINEGYSGSGRYRFHFRGVTGGRRFIIKGVEVLRDGEVVASDPHEGLTWVRQNHNSEYILDLPEPSKSPFILRAKLDLDGKPYGGRVEIEKLPTSDPAELRRQAEQTAFFEREAMRSSPLYMGFAKLFLGRDTESANQDIHAAHAAMLQESAKEAKLAEATTLTPQIAGAERLKWQMRTWIRLHYLFGDKSAFHPGRLSPENQALIKEMFWCFLSAPPNTYDVTARNAGANLRRSDPRYASAIHGSENHEIMHLGNILLAAQALKDLPEYRDRKLPNGESLQERYDRWNAFYKHRWDEMARHGLLVEAFSGYAQYTLPEICNLFDFAEDPALKKKTEMILHLIWTEWAVGQLNGIRGGGKNRIYQSSEPTNGDAWREISLFFFDNGPWGTRWHPDPIKGMPRVMASTTYRVPELIRDIAKDAAGKGEYAYMAKRYARQAPIPAAEVPVDWSPWYNFDPVDTRLLAYDHCTPDYVMGCLMLDPRLPIAPSHIYLQGADLPEGYPALSQQNLFTSIVFANNPNACVIPQGLPAAKSNQKTYLQYQAVQKHNVMMIQRHPKAGNSELLRVGFAKGMKERMFEKEGWWLLQEGNAFLAVKGFSSQDGRSACGTGWNNDMWLHLDDRDAPAVFVMGRTAQFKDIDAFAAHVLSGSSALEGRRFSFHIKDIAGDPLSLSLDLDGSGLPRINGAPVDFLPKRVFDSPFFWSDHDSGVVTIQKGGKKMVLDFNQSTVSLHEG